MACRTCGNKKSIPIVTLATNSAAATFRAAGAIVNGDQLQASPETIEARRGTCIGYIAASTGQPVPPCEYCVEVPNRKGDKVYHRCTKCGCWLDGKFFAKLKLATESCPEKKW